MGALDLAGRTFVEEVDAGHVPRDALDGRAVKRGLRERRSRAGRERVAVVAVGRRPAPSRRVRSHDVRGVEQGELRSLWRWRHLRGGRVRLRGDGDARGDEE